MSCWPMAVSPGHAASGWSCCLMSEPRQALPRVRRTGTREPESCLCGPRAGPTWRTAYCQSILIMPNPQPPCADRCGAGIVKLSPPANVAPRARRAYLGPIAPWEDLSVKYQFKGSLQFLVAIYFLSQVLQRLLPPVAMQSVIQLTQCDPNQVVVVQLPELTVARDVQPHVVH